MKRFLKALLLTIVVATLAYAADRLYRAPVAEYNRGVPALDPEAASADVDVSPRAHRGR